MSQVAVPPSSREGVSRFRIDVHPEREVVRVAPAGELDLATCAELRTQLGELRDSGFEHVVLDLRRLTFMDTSGIALILAEHRGAREDGHDFSLISGPPQIQRVLEMTGVDRLLRIDP